MAQSENKRERKREKRHRSILASLALLASERNIEREKVSERERGT